MSENYEDADHVKEGPDRCSETPGTEKPGSGPRGSPWGEAEASAPPPPDRRGATRRDAGSPLVTSRLTVRHVHQESGRRPGGSPADLAAGGVRRRRGRGRWPSPCWTTAAVIRARRTDLRGGPRPSSRTAARQGCWRSHRSETGVAKGMRLRDAHEGGDCGCHGHRCAGGGRRRRATRKTLQPTHTPTTATKVCWCRGGDATVGEQQRLDDHDDGERQGGRPRADEHGGHRAAE